MLCGHLEQCPFEDFPVDLKWDLVPMVEPSNELKTMFSITQANQLVSLFVQVRGCVPHALISIYENKYF